MRRAAFKTPAPGVATVVGPDRFCPTEGETIMRRTTCVIAAAIVAAGFQSAIPSVSPSWLEARGAAPAANPVVMWATGGGEYFLPASNVDVQFSLTAQQRADGTASGQFHHSLTLGGLLVEFHGRVICMAVDAANHRAWIGGLITQNNSEHPSFQQEIHDVGKDIWFRILDNGDGASAAPDVTTFTGFKGSGGVDTSPEYCQRQIWPANPPGIITGNVSVKP